MAGLTRVTLRHRASAASILATLSILALVGFARLETAVGYRAFLGPTHPAVRELDAFVHRFGGGLPIAAGWSCAESTACETALDAPSLAMAHAVARRLEGVAEVTRVDSPATSPVVVRPAIGLPEVRRLAPEGQPVADLDALAAAARQDPSWRGRLVSPDGRAGAIVVQLASSSSEAGARAFAALADALAPYEREGFRFHVVGGPVEFVVAGRELEESTVRIVPLMVVLIALALTALLRSPAAALAALGTVGVAVVWTLGLMGALGWPQTSLTQALTPLVLVIGVCDAIHLVARTATHRASMPGRDAVLAAARDTAAPCTMTTVTTAAGFASLAASPLEGIARFGTLAAFATLAALLLCFSLLPLLLAALPAHRLPDPRRQERGDERLARFSAAIRARRRAVWAATVGIALVAVAGLTRLRVDASFEDLYGETSTVVLWARAFASMLGPPDTLEIALEPPAGRLAVAAPRLDVLDRVVSELAGLEGLGEPRSLLDPLRHLERALHGEETLPLAERGEESRAASLLRQIRREEPGIVALLLDDASGALRITFPAQKLPQDELRALLAEVHRRLHATLPEGWTATVTGPLAIVQRMIDDIRATQLRSFAIAGLLVFLSVAAFFRSLAWGALAMVPTGMPVLLTLGAMGFGGVPLDVGSAMVAAVLLGLAVDDAIHLLFAVRRLRAEGHPLDAASDGAVRRTGRPLGVSAAALAIGFFCLLLSPWSSIARFGLVSGIAIVAALFSALVLVPALLAAGDPGQPSGSAPRPS